jgi:putative ABC transport system permease protein
MYFLTELKEGFLISFRAIRANKMRSVLTTLGIVIGIVSVTLMSTAIEGVNRAFDRSAAAFGTDVLYVQRFPWVGNEDWALIRNRRRIEADYAARIERQAMLSDYVAPVAATRRRVYRGNERRGRVRQRHDASVHERAGTTGRRPLLHCGGGMADGPSARPGRISPRPFSPRDPIGKVIRVAGHPYTVVGVFEKQGGLFGVFTSDTRVFIPLVSFESHFGGRRRDVTIQVRVADIKQMEDAKLELEGIMRKLRHIPPGKPNDFNINQQELLTETLPHQPGDCIHRLFTISSCLWAALHHEHHVCFVTERTHEIASEGYQARRRTILWCF